VLDSRKRGPAARVGPQHLQINSLKNIFMKDTPVIEFANVGKEYGDPNEGGTVVEALSEASFKINKGEFVAITGPSGSGKSTLLHLIGLLDKPTFGKIFVDGIEISDLSENKMAKLRNEKIGFVFQQFNLLPKTAAIMNVELPLIYRGMGQKERDERAKKELIAVGLGDRMNNKPSQLSGGQQQRVAIARALVTEPSLLLADEPTGNLDTKSGVEIMKIFEDLHETGVTIVLVTHNPELAEEADRQLIIRDGKIIKDTGKISPSFQDTPSLSKEGDRGRFKNKGAK
jgi:putative ABC transport system ATP-binding protein